MINVPKQQFQLEIRQSMKVIMLGIAFHKKLSFRKHVEKFVERANQKLHAFARSSAYIDPIKLEILMNSFVSQFNYCPLVWMLHDRLLNSKLNLNRERALRLACKSSAREFEKLMKVTLTTHQQNLQLLMIKVYKMKHSLNPTFMRDVFTERNNQYNLGNEDHLQLPTAKTISYGIVQYKNIQYRGCLLWSTLPKDI